MIHRRALLVLAVLIGVWSVRGAEAQAGAATGEGVLELLDATQVEEATRMLAGVPASDPLRPLASASLHFHRGRYAEALSALAAGEPPESHADRSAYLGTRISGAIEGTAGMTEQTEGNFVFRYAPGVDEVLATYAAEALEGQREAMRLLLGVAPEEPTIVEFFAEKTTFVAASGLPATWVETTGTVAICKWDRILVLSPMNMPRGYPWMDTLAHEYVHLALSRASSNEAPIWFQEGSAKVLESAWRDGDRRKFSSPYSESLLAKASKADALIPFDSMHPSMAALPSAQDATLAFAQVAYAIDYIFEQAGEKGYRRIVDETRRHGDVLRATDMVLGSAGGRFEKRYQGHIARQALQIRSNVAAFEPTIAAGAASADDTEGKALDPVLIADRKMQEHSRIGDLLRLRGRMEAALLEYRRASSVGPFHSPALANKQARALRGLGQADEAREVLAESIELYPEYTPTVTLLAALAAEAGDDAVALEMGRQAIRLNPFDPNVHEQLVAVMERTGDEEGARRERRVLVLLIESTGRR